MQNYNRPLTVPYALYLLQIPATGSIITSRSKGMVAIGSEIKSGSSLPDYKNRIIRGADATTSYQREGHKCTPGRINMKSWKRWAGDNTQDFRIESYPYALPTIPSISNPAISQEASAKLKRKLRDFTGQSNQLTNIAELKDLRRTIGSVAGSATKLVKAVLDSKKRGASLQKFAADQWLTWSFGVLPTLGAVDDAVSSVKDYLERGDQRNVEYGVHAEEWLIATNVTTTGSLHYNVNHRGSFRATRSVKITAGFKFDLRSSEDYTLGKHLGLDIESVVPTAWELLPYSWLVDYFTTAGSFLEDTFTANPGSSFYICQNTKLHIEGTVTAKAVVIPGLSQTTLEWFDYTPTRYEYFNFKREPLSNLPRAPLRFKTSKEVASHATNKLLNLTALLSSRK